MEHSELSDRLRLLGDLIAQSPHNLVSSRDRELLHTLHIPESLAVARALPIRPSKHEQHWIDLGTGGGLPGLVCALVHPNVGWTLIDARTKKITAVNEFIEALELENCRAIDGRAEILARSEDFRGLYDGVVSRAMARLDVLAELSRGFLKPRGLLMAVKGPSLVQERGYFQQASKKLRMREVTHEEIVVKGDSSVDRQTFLVTIAAAGGPPRGVPRRDGIPQSTPIGGGSKR